MHGLKKIVLFLPPYPGPTLGPPLGLLCLAAPLREAGFEVRIVDAAVVPDFEASMEAEASDALCVGISLLTGPMIHGAISVGNRLKARRPELPIVLGGWHPSLLPQQTLEASFVDAVVRNQGELTFLELVRRLEAGQSLHGLAGCSFRDGAELVHNPDRPTAPIASLPPPAYDLVDIELYHRQTGLRKLPYASSVGCPYACNYCTDTVFYNRRFNAYSAERVVQEMTALARTNRLEEISLLDSNFPVDVRRALAIARGILETGIKFRWTFQASTDLLCRLEDRDVCLLGEAGVSHIGFGTESASEEVLLQMNKRHQRIPDMFETARKCALAGIRVTFNIIVGYPGESEDDRQQTWQVMSEIGKRYPNVSFSPNIFTPYPGIPIWPELRQRGVREPESLEAWAGLSLGTNLLPWLDGEPYRRVELGLSYFLLRVQLFRMAQRVGTVRRLALSVVGHLLQWRFQRQFYHWPFEIWLARAARGLVLRRSLLTGQNLEEAC